MIKTGYSTRSLINFSKYLGVHKDTITSWESNNKLHIKSISINKVND